MSNAIGIDVPDSLIDVVHAPDGMVDGSDSEEALMGVGVLPFPDHLRIPRSDYDDWIRENEKNKSFPIDYSSRYTHQGSSHECVYHARSQLFECAWNETLGMEFAVWTSPLFGYRQVKGANGRYGGANVNESLRRGMSVGFLPEFDGPAGKLSQHKKFLHTMQQTSGRSEDHWPEKGWPASLPEGYEQTARHFRILEAFWIPDANAHFSAILRLRRGVGNGRNGHSIPHVAVVKDSRGRYLSKYRDSYNRDLYDTESMLGGGYCINSIVKPENPARPAGSDMKENA